MRRGRRISRPHADPGVVGSKNPILLPQWRRDRILPRKNLMCRCAERRAAIVSGAKAFRQGDTVAVKAEAKAFMRSVAADGRAALASAVSAARLSAHARLVR
jgi:hypothetical protein